MGGETPKLKSLAKVLLALRTQLENPTNFF